jgi:2-phosphoglycolate phosphatase
MRRISRAGVARSALSELSATDPRPPVREPGSTRGIAFDLDGTLVDSYQAIAESLNHARSAFGQPALSLDSVRASVGHGLESLVAELVGPDRVVEGVRLFRERYAQVYERTRILPGVRSTLRTLSSRGYRMSVASNKPARFGAAIVSRLGLAPFLVAVEGPDLAGTTKPEPTMLRRCLLAMDVEPRQALYVGDMVLDVESAARAGVPVALVCGGSSSPAALRATGQLVLERFSDLLDLLP